MQCSSIRFEHAISFPYMASAYTTDIFVKLRCDVVKEVSVIINCLYMNRLYEFLNCLMMAFHESRNM